jgi:hypothetical protein
VAGIARHEAATIAVVAWRVLNLMRGLPQAVGDDALKPQWQLANVRQHEGLAVVSPTRSREDAARAGRSELG